MPDLSDVRDAIAGAVPAYHAVRREYLKRMRDLVQRDVILYASDFLQLGNANVSDALLMINNHDIQHMMSVISGLSESNERSRKLDLILHSYGGSLEATEQIVNYLRKRYDYIRVIVPQNAMSAATMLACAADEIMLGHHSALGPTDPQISLDGTYFVAAQSIINEFKQAQKEVIKNENMLPFWMARIGSWPLGLLDACEKDILLSQEMVYKWLHNYMKLEKDAAESAAEYLADAEEHLTHGRPLNFDKLKAQNLNVTQLESNQELQDVVLTIFHATMVTFERTSCFKIVENHLGKGEYPSVLHSS